MVDARRGADKIIGVHHGRKFGQLVSGKEKIDRDSGSTRTSGSSILRKFSRNGRRRRKASIFVLYIGV